jgi:iron complex transport system ATP-binding protein
VADEPVAGLDPDAQFLALELLAQQALAGAAVVVTLHDLNLAARLCDRLVVLNRGQIVADGSPRQVLTGEVLRSVFGLDGGLIETEAGLTLAACRRPA